VLLRSKAVDGKSMPQLMVTLLRWLGSPARMIGDRPDTERGQSVVVIAFVRGEVGEDLSSWVPCLDVLATPALVEADPQDIKEEKAPSRGLWAELAPAIAAGNGNGYAGQRGRDGAR
ncbi:MAG: hypothetical protein ACREOV_12085, partial [Candidatus Dormibacteraceae bacterium]